MPKPKSDPKTLAMKLLREGQTTGQVGADPRVNRHPSTIRRWAKKAGIVLEYPHNRHEDRSDLVNVHEIVRLRKRSQGGKPLFTLQEIADLCNCSYSYVKQVCAQARQNGEL